MAQIIRFSDVWVRGELGRTPEGRRALEHHAAAQAAQASTVRRHHNRAAQRIARRALGK